MGFKHLVILGAGSTIATIPDGDKNGIKAYTLSNFLEDPFYAHFLSSLDSKYSNLDIEGMCEKMYREDKDKYDEFEALIRNKYASLELPDGFTILERLIMSLTADDAIVSFNWDDLVIQAYNRATQFIPSVLLPKIVFPHGNAQACYNEHRYGSRRNPQNIGLNDSPLNMPIDELDYKNNLFIESQWKILNFYMRYAQMITLFGYRGPVSDQQEVLQLKELLKLNQICARIEIIDKTKEEAEIVAKNLNCLVELTQCEAECCGNFYESRIAQFPRRTLRSLDNWNYESKPMPILDRYSFIKLISPIVEEEQDLIDKNTNN